MKKVLVLLLVTFMVLLLVACGGSYRFADASDHSKMIGHQHVEIVDEFLDGTISVKQARERLDGLSEIDTDSVGDSTADLITSTTNMLLRQATFSLRISVGDYAFSGSNDCFDIVIERRNTLAEGLGMSAR